MKRILATFLMITFLFPAFCLGETSKNSEERREYIQQQMVLMGLYLYGIRKEVGRKRVDYDNVEFLAESLSDITTQMKRTKGGDLFHANLSDLLSKVDALKEASAKDHSKVKERAQAVIQTCGSCHRGGVGPE